MLRGRTNDTEVATGILKFETKATDRKKETTPMANKPPQKDEHSFL